MRRPCRPERAGKSWRLNILLSLCLGELVVVGCLCKLLQETLGGHSVGSERTRYLRDGPQIAIKLRLGRDAG